MAVNGTLEVHDNVVFEANTAASDGGAVSLPFDLGLDMTVLICWEPSFQGVVRFPEAVDQAPSDVSMNNACDPTLKRLSPALSCTSMKKECWRCTTTWCSRPTLDHRVARCASRNLFARWFQIAEAVD